MKKYFLALIGFAVAAGSPLLAQTAAPAVAGAPVVMVEPQGGACCPARTTCVPEQYMKKTVKTVYSKGCEPLCLCYYRGLFQGCDCQSGHCEQPYTRHYLIKKSRTCEECATKCVPGQAPACDSGHCVALQDCAGTAAPAVAPPVVVTPAVPVQPKR